MTCGISRARLRAPFTPFIAWTLLLAAATHARAQERTFPAEQLRRIFASRDFAPEGFGPARWMDGGAAYTTVEPSATLQGGDDIVRYETATGARQVYVAAERLVPPGASAPLPVDDYGWSPDGSRLLLFTSSQRVWRDNTRGDYWVLDRASGKLQKLGGAEAPPSSLMFAKFSPQGDRVAYVRQGDLWVERLADGRITRLTADASRTRVNGTTDWVYEEEFGLRDAFRWSPDGTRIAYCATTSSSTTPTRSTPSPSPSSTRRPAPPTPPSAPPW
jgi:dipeptidyl-peptidase-4